jgi:hypothetical protein
MKKRLWYHKFYSVYIKKCSIDPNITDDKLDWGSANLTVHMMMKVRTDLKQINCDIGIFL